SWHSSSHAIISYIFASRRRHTRFKCDWSSDVCSSDLFNQFFNDNNTSFNTKTMGLFLSPDATNHGQYILGAPNIRIQGFEQTGLTPPEGRSDLTLHFTDIVSYSVGKHQFRYGAEVRRGKLDELY